MNIRRAAGFALRDKEGRVLLQHRDEKAPINPNRWGIFGGQIEGDETPEETVVREAKEELGIELKDLKFFRKFEFHEEGSTFEAFIFVAPLLYSVEQLRKQQTEGKDLGLFSFEQTKKLKTSNHTKEMLRVLFNK